MSYDSKYNPEAPSAPDGRADTSHPQLQAQLGAVQALKDMRMLYTVLPGNRLERIAGKKLVMVTDAPSLRPEQVDALERYVLGGGSLYISGATDPELARRLLGLEYQGMTQEKLTYAAPTALGEACFSPEYTAQYPLQYEGRQALVSNPQNHPVLARITLPYTDPADAGRFASIHSNPPGPETEYPAAILGQGGEGKVLWLSFCPEKAQAAAPRQVTRNLIGLLHTASIVATDAHPCLELTLFDDGEGYILHAVNVQQEPALPLPGYQLTLSLPRAVKEARLAPSGEPVAMDTAGGKITLQMPAPGMFTTVKLA